MSIYKKLHAVMCETKSLERDKEVGYGRNAYKAISEATVLNEIKPLFKKHGLIIFPIEVQANDRVDNFLTKDGEASRLMTQVLPKWKIVDIDTGEFEIIASIGNGVDTQDKGSGKAMTYSLKVALQKTFMMFSGEDTDNEHSDSITEKQTMPADPKLKNQLVDAFNAMDETRQKAALNHYKVKDIVDLPVDLWSKATKMMLK